MERSHAHRPIETRLIGGFLGAGKTTFILEQLQTAGAKVAVLVNEFGRLGIDGALIRLKGGIEVVELPGGCICCSQQQGLVASIRKIAQEISPELLLIEPSGVAEISELLQVLADPELSELIRLSSVVTVIDAETFLEFSEPEAFGLFFLDQVRCADLVLINKSDLVSRNVLRVIEKRIAQHNPVALTARTEFCRVAAPLARGSNSRRAPASRKTSAPLNLECVSLAMARSCSEEELSRFLVELKRGRFGRIMRGKGFIEVTGRGWLNLQIVAGKATATPMPAGLSPRLILIGFGLRGEELETYWETPGDLQARQGTNS